MTLSVVATPLPANVPPQVQIDITGTGADAGAAFTLTATADDGRPRPVIIEANPHLTGGGWSGFDYHAPFNQPVTYTVTTGVQATAAPVTLSVADSWILHRTNPALSVKIDRVIGIGPRTFPSTAAAHFGFNAKYPVTRNEGVRRANSGSLTVEVDTPASLDALQALLADSGVCLLNLTSGSSDAGAWWDEKWAWVQVGDYDAGNPEDWLYFPTRELTLPYQVVDTPAAAISPVWTWETLLADPALLTWADVMATYDSWSDVIVDHRSA